MSPPLASPGAAAAAATASVLSFANEYFSLVAHAFPASASHLYDTHDGAGARRAVVKVLVDLVALTACAVLGVLHFGDSASVGGDVRAQAVGTAAPLVLAFVMPTLIMQSVVLSAGPTPRSQLLVGGGVIAGLASFEALLAHLATHDWRQALAWEAAALAVGVLVRLTQPASPKRASGGRRGQGSDSPYAWLALFFALAIARQVALDTRPEVARGTAGFYALHRPLALALIVALLAVWARNRRVAREAAGVEGETKRA